MNTIKGKINHESIIMKKKVVKSLQCIALSSFLLLQTVACGRQDMDNTQNEDGSKKYVNGDVASTICYDNLSLGYLTETDISYTGIMKRAEN